MAPYCSRWRCLIAPLFFLLLTQTGLGAIGLNFGASAEALFLSNVTDLGDTHLDFDELPSGTQLESQYAGVLFQSITTTAGDPRTPIHMVIGSTSLGRQGQIVGTPFLSGTDDARVGFHIVFDSPQLRAGLLRLWNTNTLTFFYNESDVLLGSHQNTQNTEFVGWIGDPGDSSTWVTKIVVDGILDGGSRQVGYADNLIFGTAIPEPAHTAGLLLGSCLLALVYRHYASRSCKAKCA